MTRYHLLIILVLLSACNAVQNSESVKEKEIITEEVSESPVPEEKEIETSLPLHKVNLPEGFKISVYAEGVENARSMSLSPKGTLFVGTRDAGNVYALIDEDKDYHVDKIFTIAKGLNMPNGVAFRNGSLYVAEVNKILRYDNIEENLESVPKPIVVFDDLPSDRSHGWKYIAFGPDDKLYIPIGAPCNICEPDKELYASISRINPDGSDFEVYAKGVRNSVGFNWHPETKELWFTENGRDWLGDDEPACELNHAPKQGMHFGYPYCHQGDLSDPKFGHKKPCSEFVKPAQNLAAHVAPLGMEFYTGNQFPEIYNNQILLAEHGSWNRTVPQGYRLMQVRLEGNKAISYEVFADGWLQLDKPWGRPVDLEHLPDGSLLVSDDYANAIYRISYKD